MSIILAAVAWLLTYLVHSTVLLAGALLLAGVGLVRSPAARDTLWKVALVGGLVTATAQLALRLQPWAGHVALEQREASPLVDVAGIREHAAPAAPGADIAFPAGRSFANAVAAAPSADEAVASRRTVVSLVRGMHVSWPAIILNFWFLGALAFGARLVWARAQLARDLRDRRRIHGGPLFTMLADLSEAAGVRPPALSVSERLTGPIAFGGEICLPARVQTRLVPTEQRAVLAHELGHVVRRDPAWLTAALAVEALLYLQPLNRCARRRLRATSEFLCDDWAAERTDGMVLARSLAEVAEWVQARPTPATVPGMTGHCSQLVSRVERLVDGRAAARPARWAIRTVVASAALALVAWTVPGVAAEHLAAVSSGDASDAGTPSGQIVPASLAAWDGDGWARLAEDGRLLLLAPGYSVRLRGHGTIGIREWGRALALPDGYELQVGGRAAHDGDICAQSAVRIVEIGGDGSWDIIPVRQGSTGALARSETRWERGAAGPEARPWSRGLRQQDAGFEDVRQVVRSAIATSMSVANSASGAVSQADVDAAMDAAFDGEADAAIDTLVQLFVRDPEAVRRAARRIARTYDRDLRPEFERMGVEMGRELAPQLQRLTDRVGRDLSPEFARLGAELGRSIVSALAEPDESGDGANVKPPKKN